MSDLLKLRFVADWDYEKSCECYRIDIEEVDKLLVGLSSSINDRKDITKYYYVTFNDSNIELILRHYYPSFARMNYEIELIKVLDSGISYVDADNLEEVFKALEMLKPEIEKYRNIRRDKELAKEKRMALWFEKEPFEFIL